MSPGEAIRLFCRECVGNENVKEIRRCGGDEMYGQGDQNNVCWFYKHRLGKVRASVRTIRKHCLECMGGVRDLVERCGTPNCPVRPFRFGKNPNVSPGTVKNLLGKGR